MNTEQLRTGLETLGVRGQVLPHDQFDCSWFDYATNSANADTRAYILNTGASGTPGEHWVCFYVFPFHIEFFDSYGQPPTLYFPEFRYPKPIEYSRMCVQGLESSYCGHHVLYYLDQRQRRIGCLKDMERCYDRNLLHFNDRHVSRYCRTRFCAVYATRCRELGRGDQCCQPCATNAAKYGIHFVPP